MGRAIGMSFAFFAGVRVAGQLTYIPQHIKNGKKINARAIIPVMKNSNRGTNQRDGSQGRIDDFKLVAWGKLADTCCRSCSPGKALDILAEIQSYNGRLFTPDGVVRVDNTGQGIMVKKTSFTIMNIIFGEESAKHIMNEVQQGHRPPNWDNPQHTDYQLWLTVLKQRQAIVWNGTDQNFGYARVSVPQGPGITLDFSAPTATAPANVPAQGGFNMPAMVANVFGAATAPQNQAVAPAQNVAPNAITPAVNPAMNMTPAGGGTTAVVAGPAVDDPGV